MKNKIIDSFY